MYNRLRNFTLLVAGLAFFVVLLGAYTRLKDAGLGCPDWPGCYGKLIAPPDEKAWIEMIHRYVASSLGLLIVMLAIWRFNLISVFLVSLVIFQGMLGMWTVTLGLYPVVVMGHLLGGFALLTTLWLYYLNLSPRQPINISKIKLWAWLGLIVTSVQIALGGWTSANYAALVCADFPSCQGNIWPHMDVINAFDLTGAGIFDSPGTPLENTARVTIQMFHRIGAIFTLIVLSIIATKLISKRYSIGFVLIALLTVQLALGITNVLAALPLPVSLMHNLVAALLLLTIVTILYRTYAK